MAKYFAQENRNNCQYNNHNCANDKQGNGVARNSRGIVGISSVLCLVRLSSTCYTCYTSLCRAARSGLRICGSFGNKFSITEIPCTSNSCNSQRSGAGARARRIRKSTGIAEARLLGFSVFARDRCDAEFRVISVCRNPAVSCSGGNSSRWSYVVVVVVVVLDNVVVVVIVLDNVVVVVVVVIVLDNVVVVLRGVHTSINRTTFSLSGISWFCYFNSSGTKLS